MLLRGLALAVLLTACGDSTLKHMGEKCVSSSECASGLLCDSAGHVCTGMETVDAAGMQMTDGRLPVDARPRDAAVMIDAPID